MSCSFPQKKASPSWILLLLLILSLRTSLSGAEKSTLTGARLLARIHRQPVDSRPPVFSLPSPSPQIQLAIVIDGTTSMKRELEELSLFLDDIRQLFSEGAPETLQMAVVLYRDARSPSGVVSVVSDFSNDFKAVLEKVQGLKVETGEPYFPEGMDQGLHVALNQLAWQKGEEVSRRMLIIADAPPYAEDHPNRKYKTAELNSQIKRLKVRVDSLLVNSGFAVSGLDGTSQESATKAAPDAQKFLSELTGNTAGVFLDFWNPGQIAALQEPTVIVSEIAAIPTPEATAPTGIPTIVEWRTLLLKSLSSVRTERPALRALSALSQIRPRSTENQSPYPLLWPAAELKGVLSDLHDALDEEPENPILHLISANTHFLFATADAWEDHVREGIDHIHKARRSLNDKTPPAIRSEVEALYAVHVLGDRNVAHESFLKLTSSESEEQNPGCRLRSAWSLLALELGFWPAGVRYESRSVNQSTARDLIQQICKEWPNSVEGRALQQWSSVAVSHELELTRSLFTLPRTETGNVDK